MDTSPTGEGSPSNAGEPSPASMGVVPETDPARVRAKHLGLPYEELDPASISPETLASIPEKALRRHTALPLRREGDLLVVAMADPSDIYAVENLRVISGFRVSPVVSAETSIKKALNRVFGGSAEGDVAAGEALAEAGDPDFAPEGSVVVAESTPDDAPVVRLFDAILRRAIAERASDIHVEPLAERLSIRFRIDGALREAMSVSSRLRNGLVTRVKVLADLDIAERRIPQDGRFTTQSANGRIDLRVASLPTVHGEGVVLRILDTSSLELDFARLGFPARDLARYEKVFRRPYGTILVTGPTGSGKSTTLYATLAELNSPEKKIITIEDPVEYRLSGLNQIQINHKAGLTFASGLRHVLRADPDVVMIGEIRDPQTARTSIEAALTGHLVLATLHTNDASSALTRLTDMGVEPYLCASAIDCVIAQRLVRRLCDGCKRPVEIKADTLDALGFPFALSDERSFFEPSGCEGCTGTGYRGRTGLFEMMEVTDDVRELVLRRASSGEISRAAQFSGMPRLKDDGLLKAAEGTTSIEEILRIIV